MRLAISCHISPDFTLIWNIEETHIECPKWNDCVIEETNGRLYYGTKVQVFSSSQINDWKHYFTKKTEMEKFFEKASEYISNENELQNNPFDEYLFAYRVYFVFSAFLIASILNFIFNTNFYYSSNGENGKYS